jgi:hypothetical protein
MHGFHCADFHGIQNHAIHFVGLYYEEFTQSGRKMHKTRENFQLRP